MQHMYIVPLHPHFWGQNQHHHHPMNRQIWDSNTFSTLRCWVLAFLLATIITTFNPITVTTSTINKTKNTTFILHNSMNIKAGFMKSPHPQFCSWECGESRSRQSSDSQWKVSPVSFVRSDKMCLTMLVTTDTTASVTLIFMTSITKRVMSAYTRLEQHIHFWIGELVGQ